MTAGQQHVKAEVRYGVMQARYPDGSVLRMKRTVITVDDWRDTPLGRMNVGHVHFMPWEFERIPAPQDMGL